MNKEVAMQLQKRASASGVRISNIMRKSIYTRTKKHSENEPRSRDAAAKKRANTSGVGKCNNYCKDIYSPPYNNTH